MRGTSQTILSPQSRLLYPFFPSSSSSFPQLNSRKNAVAQSWVVGNKDSGGVRTVATARCGGSSSSSQEADNGKEETPDREPTCTLLPT
jgi:hypothetical protein